MSTVDFSLIFGVILIFFISLNKEREKENKINKNIQKEIEMYINNEVVDMTEKIIANYRQKNKKWIAENLYYQGKMISIIENEEKIHWNFIHNLYENIEIQVIYSKFEEKVNVFYRIGNMKYPFENVQENSLFFQISEKIRQI